MSVLKSLGVVAAAAFAFAATPAFANSLTIGGGIATVTCSPSCAGIIGGSITSSSQGAAAGTIGTTSTTNAALYSFNPSSPATEAAVLNVLAGTNFSTGAQTDTAGASSITFNTVAQWLTLKIGNQHFFLRNTAGAVTLAINYVKASGKAGAGGGLSHYTEFGSNTPVPIPGALWLMGAGLAGLGFALRGKKNA